MSEPAFQTYTVEEYLEMERHSEVRHEYLGGAIIAMAGESKHHNAITLNLASAIQNHLRGKPYNVFMENVKVHVKTPFNELFYYPDLVITCDPTDEEDPYIINHPRLIIEVLSPSTKQRDEAEKYLALQLIDSFEEYVLVDQDPDARQVRILRKNNNWALTPENDITESGEIRLETIDLNLTLDQIYDFS